MLDADRAGELAGVQRFRYDGTQLPVSDDEIATAAVTTRDVDRGESPHFLLKEITESPRSMRKTLRGKIVERDGSLHAAVGDRALPTSRTRRDSPTARSTASR